MTLQKNYTVKNHVNASKKSRHKINALSVMSSLQESPNCIFRKFNAIPVPGNPIREYQPAVDALFSYFSFGIIGELPH